MKNTKSIIPSSLSLVFVLAVIMLIVNHQLPKIGHDYGYHIPRMLDGYLHQKINSLTIQWYTPSFGGGIPAYPNPQDIQFSLPQLLMFVVNPWLSLMISLAIYSTLGFVSFYLLLNDECGFTQNSSVLGSIFILANGFFVEHAIVGHVGFQVFPLLGSILYLIFSKKIGYILAGILIGGIWALIVNQSGFYIAFIFCLSLLILLPLMYLLTPHLFNWQRISSVFLTSIFFTLTLSASKLWAVYSFMRFFPREISDIYAKTYFQGLGGLAWQLAGGMFIIPYFAMTGQSFNGLDTFFQHATGANNNIWETDISISPTLVLILIYGIIRKFSNLIQRNQKPNLSRSKIAAILFLILGVWLVIDFSLAKGWLFEFFKVIPIIRSLHVNVRYVSAFIFPMAFTGAYIFNRYTKQNGMAVQTKYGFWGILTTILFLLFYLLPTEQVYRLSFNINQPMMIYSQIEKGERFPVMNIESLKDINVFTKQASNLNKIFEPIFGYDLEFFHPSLHIGSVFDIEDGYYNMTNPASYVFPDENNLKPFERFRVD